MARLDDVGSKCHHSSVNDVLGPEYRKRGYHLPNGIIGFK